MKKFVFCTVMMVMFSLMSFAKFYVCKVTKDVNFREGPSTEYQKKFVISQGDYIFIDTNEKVGNYYKAIHIDSDEIGYVAANYVRFVQEVVEDPNGVLQVVDYTSSLFAEVEIKNDTRNNVMITIGPHSYKFQPHEKRMITIEPNTYKIKASSPGVIPYVGTDKVEGGRIYSWVFYTYTTKR